MAQALSIEAQVSVLRIVYHLPQDEVVPEAVGLGAAMAG